MSLNQPLQFAYWVPNVSGGLVISQIEQRTRWDAEYNRKLAQIAEQAGFDYALTQIRFTAGYGADNQHESVTFSQDLLSHTSKLKVIAALLPGPWNPYWRQSRLPLSAIFMVHASPLILSAAGSGASSRQLVNPGSIMKSAICVQKSLFAACAASGVKRVLALPAIFIASAIT